MSLLIQYLVKLSISLAVVWLFYQFILRRLTFYNSNRWYLLGYTLLSFFIPFINISSIIGNNSGSKNDLIQFIPSVHQYTIALEEASHCPIPIWSTQYDKWDWTAFALMTGAVILLLRFIIRYISFIRIRHRSELISDDGIKIYQVNKEIIPFSFGNAVFINRNQHSDEELKEIVRHEFVHVRQNHTIDIVWAELLCILNWYNPFTWLLKRSIRQNLEFIADNKVIENGINKKEYQYL
ncbi:MAG TPA: M56 family metallopeptidase, partial [Chitinophagaceae bacterium]